MTPALISTQVSARDFIRIARCNPVNASLLSRLRSLDIPQCHLTAGCLFQALWNTTSGQPADRGVSDYDIFYFDDSDLSYEAEDRVIREVGTACADLDVKIEVRNQARVHLWYPERFGRPYPPLKSARDGIDRYLVACTCVGVDVASGELYAPDSLDDLAAGILRINPRFPDPVQFRRKALSYQERWPWLRIVENEG
ncbi:nucleotidyltransferase family protein [Diaphorobacter sp. HDW4A]|uniref:nucleotidyltransferase family protein n=1 Tax=Diaphorobacter sp. HDW4A TaxID=2714924 RepID=UPI00140CC4F5|nr:nucleotidyltransferase family protein [Diaphorobacter sp. HDW4A]QIL78519.1 nucleotidyltransferase family protein [Diaphorobacter sp. HDW4A]